jgi:hypothetical protein
LIGVIVQQFVLKIIFAVSFFSVVSVGMESNQQFTQRDFDHAAAALAKYLYAKINQNVTFLERSSTKSEYWDEFSVIAKNFFVKKRGEWSLHYHFIG